MKNSNLTYISLFSGAGIGCYGFKEEGFSCIATVELLEKRLKFQKYNEICRYDSGYICGDIQENSVKKLISVELNKWKCNKVNIDLDVLNYLLNIKRCRLLQNVFLTGLQDKYKILIYSLRK